MENGMKRAKALSEVDALISRAYDNTNLIIESSRRSVSTEEQRKRIHDVAFEGAYKYYSTEDLAEMLRTQQYQINFLVERLHQMFCGGHSLVQLHYDLYSSGDNRTKEMIQHFQDLLDFHWHLGSDHREVERIFHDETKGGWHHEQSIHDWKPEK